MLLSLSFCLLLHQILVHVALIQEDAKTPHQTLVCLMRCSLDLYITTILTRHRQCYFCDHAKSTKTECDILR